MTETQQTPLPPPPVEPENVIIIGIMSKFGNQQQYVIQVLKPIDNADIIIHLEKVINNLNDIILHAETRGERTKSKLTLKDLIED